MDKKKRVVVAEVATTSNVLAPFAVLTMLCVFNGISFGKVECYLRGRGRVVSTCVMMMENGCVKEGVIFLSS